MPELPDIEAYIAALRPRIMSQPIQRLRILGPSILRTFEPSIETAEGRVVGDLSRIGKRIVLHLDGPGELAVVIHLMIAGRFQWKEVGAKPPGKITSAVFAFPSGTLILTEAGTKKRAQLHLVSGKAALAAHDPGGIDIYSCSEAAFAAALRRENHTIKRTLTDPRILSGIGNAFSDEILHAAKMSPIKMTSKLTDEEIWVRAARTCWLTRHCVPGSLRNDSGGRRPLRLRVIYPSRPNDYGCGDSPAPQ